MPQPQAKRIVNALFDTIVIHIAAKFFSCFEVNNHLEVLKNDFAPWLFFQFKKAFCLGVFLGEIDADIDCGGE